jgi:Hypothetical protein (DUF2513)
MLMSKPAIQEAVPIVIIALNRNGRAMMTRDMELIRKILLEIKGRENVRMSTMTIPGYEDWVLARHLELLLEAGLIDGLKSAPLSEPYPTIMVKDLTWEGHDFLAAVENDGVWSRIKETFSAKELAAMPLSILKGASLAVLQHVVMAKLGM